ncbi:DUF192 domain-containing protein [Patescibacteria group bacterium]
MKNIKKYKNVIAIGAIVFLSGLYYLVANNVIPYSLDEHRVRKVYVGEKSFKMEMVDEPKYLIKGLGGRRFMCQNCGMFFDFNRKNNHGIWMKDMNFDLDIIWVLEGKIVWIEESVSYEDSLRVYGERVTSDAVLEISDGLVEKYNIKVGDNVTVR